MSAKLSESVTLLVISRLSMAALGPLALIAGAYIELRFSTITAQAEVAATIGRENSDEIDDLSGDMLVVQNNQTTGRTLRDAQYAAVISLIDKLSKEQSDNGETLAYIKARVDVLVESERGQ